MYLYLDESGTDGKSEFIYVGGVFSEYKIRNNFIKKNITKRFKRVPNLNEYKFSNKNIDNKLKLKVLEEIKKEFSFVFFKEKVNNKKTKDLLCLLISKCIKHVHRLSGGKDVYVVYDRISIKITDSDLQKCINNSDVKFKFDMQDSNFEKGIQIADWVVGAARLRLIEN